ncbi:MAG: hypothetical protein A2Y12_02310 [Planctomycetes bacterium GWF2_42_9]|nr:MAG: hypothetical protein A2Y12_02310 [Planctomycetes bacterium GWF2_42_9]
MRGNRKNLGLTGVEIMVAVAVLAVLVGAVIGLTTHIRAQANKELAKSTIIMLGTALEQYYDYWHEYPPDCNYASKSEIESLYNVNSVTVSPALDTQFAGSGMLYYSLRRTPSSNKILGKLHDKALSAKNADNPAQDMELEITYGGTMQVYEYPFFYTQDPWNMPLRYSRTWATPTLNRTDKDFKFTKDFPKLESAGPDKTFDTEDDITSKDN